MNATWDAHAHVIGDPTRFPLWSGRGYTPAAASLEDYLAMLDRHGIDRGVLVQPSVYGSDKACLLDALDRAGGRLRGVAVPPPDATARELGVLHGHGVRAVRCNTIDPGGLPPDVVAGWRSTLAALGWHVELHLSACHEDDARALLRRRHHDAARPDARRRPDAIQHAGRAPGTAGAPDHPHSAARVPHPSGATLGLLDPAFPGATRHPGTDPAEAVGSKSEIRISKSETNSKYE